VRTFVAIALCAACGGARDPLATPPAITIERWTMPALHDRVLASGLRVIHVENHRLPYVAISTVVGDAGSRADGDHLGLAAIAAQVAAASASDRDTAVLGRAGATLDTAISADAATFTIAGPSAHLAEDLAVIAELLHPPQPAPSELERVRAAAIAELTESAARPRAIAARLFERLAFGAHPYAHPAEGAAKEVAAIDLARIVAFWAAHYRARGATLVVVGDIDSAALDAMVDNQFAASADTAAPPAAVIAPSPAAAQLAYVDTPGAARAIVMIGHLAAGSQDPRADATDVADEILAGGAGSRLSTALSPIATGVAATAWRGAWAGTWAVTTAVDAAHTGRAVAQILAAAHALTDRELPELDHARLQLAADLAASFDSDEAAARMLARRIGRGESTEQIHQLGDRIAAIDARSVHASAETWTGLTVVIVGDWSKIAPTLPALDLPIQRYEAP